MTRRCLVTGAAGFIGSHLAESLLASGFEVIATDAFVPYYPRTVKESNLRAVQDHPRFRFVEADLRVTDLSSVIDDSEIIFHLAAMPGLRLSWTASPLLQLQHHRDPAAPRSRAKGRRRTLHLCIDVERLREASHRAGELAPPLCPASPYGITKLAAEHLCRAYERIHALPVTILRYFSVYGPRQRPDMAYHILIQSLLTGGRFTVFGDGEQTRSNTFVSDCVAATVLAAERRNESAGETFNIGGGQVATLNEAICQIEELTGKTARIDRCPSPPGDQRHTAAQFAKATKLLGYRPLTGLAEGLRAQVEWHRKMLDLPTPAD